MSNITITIPTSSAPFLINAIRYYSESLIGTVEEGLNTPSWTVTAAKGKMVASAKPLSERQISNELAKWSNDVMKGIRIDAPYGLKKDGTPKKQPGRKSAKVKK